VGVGKDRDRLFEDEEKDQRNRSQGHQGVGRDEFFAHELPDTRLRLEVVSAHVTQKLPMREQPTPASAFGQTIYKA